MKKLLTIIILAVSAYSLTACSGARSSCESGSDDGNEGSGNEAEYPVPTVHKLGEITNRLAGDGCDWVIDFYDPKNNEADPESKMPMNLTAAYQKNGLKVSVKYRLSRAVEKCKGVAPIIIDHIKIVE